MEGPRWADAVVQAGTRWRQSGEDRRRDGAAEAGGCRWSWPHGQDVPVERPRTQDAAVEWTRGGDGASHDGRVRKWRFCFLVTSGEDEWPIT
jgi:hypothetical protein